MRKKEERDAQKKRGGGGARKKLLATFISTQMKRIVKSCAKIRTVTMIAGLCTWVDFVKKNLPRPK